MHASLTDQKGCASETLKHTFLNQSTFLLPFMCIKGQRGYPRKTKHVRLTPHAARMLDTEDPWRPSNLTSLLICHRPPCATFLSDSRKYWNPTRPPDPLNPSRQRKEKRTWTRASFFSGGQPRRPVPSPIIGGLYPRLWRTGKINGQPVAATMSYRLLIFRE